jgi:hypothetical protein
MSAILRTNTKKRNYLILASYGVLLVLKDPSRSKRTAGACLLLKVFQDLNLPCLPQLLLSAPHLRYWLDKRRELLHARPQLAAAVSGLPIRVMTRKTMWIVPVFSPILLRPILIVAQPWHALAVILSHMSSMALTSYLLATDVALLHTSNMELTLYLLVIDAALLHMSSVGLILCLHALAEILTTIMIVLLVAAASVWTTTRISTWTPCDIKTT